MKYLMLVAVEPIDDPITPPEGDIERWVETHDSSGARFYGDRLAPASQSKVVRARRNGNLVTDGPLAEAHEHIAGFDILEAASMDEAVAIALDHPMAKEGVIEVRPFFDWDAQE
jgi:hypothetical protein